MMSDPRSAIASSTARRAGVLLCTSEKAAIVVTPATLPADRDSGLVDELASEVSSTVQLGVVPEEATPVVAGLEERVEAEGRLGRIGGA